MRLGRTFCYVVIITAFLLLGAASVNADYWTIHIETDAESCGEIDYEPSGSEVDFAELSDAVVMIYDMVLFHQRATLSIRWMK